MSATDTIKVGEPLPRVASVTAHDKWAVTVDWAEGERRIVDLAPVIFTYKVYRPLREDPELFKTVHAVHGGCAIAWGADDDIDMDASTVARLGAEAMEPAEFAEFLKRHRLTFDAAAAQLGISRRLVAYYASERELPRYMALACKYLDEKLARKAADAAAASEAHPSARRTALAESVAAP
jgi:hypothetical protein